MPMMTSGTPIHTARYHRHGPNRSPADANPSRVIHLRTMNALSAGVSITPASSAVAPIVSDSNRTPRASAMNSAHHGSPKASPMYALTPRQSTPGGLTSFMTAIVGEDDPEVTRIDCIVS